MPPQVDREELKARIVIEYKKLMTREYFRWINKTSTKPIGLKLAGKARQIIDYTQEHYPELLPQLRTIEKEKRISFNEELKEYNTIDKERQSVYN